MSVLLFSLTVWGLWRLSVRLSRPRRRAARMKPKPSTAEVMRCNLATLTALHGQRDQIEQALNWCDDLISTEDNPEKVIRWMTKKAQLRGQLATVEAKISKLTG